jgi:hypothetical protein
MSLYYAVPNRESCNAQEVMLLPCILSDSEQMDIDRAPRRDYDSIVIDLAYPIQMQMAPFVALPMNYRKTRIVNVSATVEKQFDPREVQISGRFSVQIQLFRAVKFAVGMRFGGHRRNVRRAHPSSFNMCAGCLSQC